VLNAPDGTVIARHPLYQGIGHIPEVECWERFNADLFAFLP
jgi:hypothetical protein